MNTVTEPMLQFFGQGLRRAGSPLSGARGMTPGEKALNRLVKWRSILTGWQLGTSERGDPAADAVRDHREVTLLLRVEVNALVMLLTRKGVFTHDEWDAQLVDDAQHLERQLEIKFPGAHAEDDGMHLDTARVVEWMSKFPE